MKYTSDEAILLMNKLGKNKIPFVFLIDFEAKKPIILALSEAKEKFYWSTPNNKHLPYSKVKPHLTKWNTKPVSFDNYKKGFDTVQKHIQKGDTFLLNYTQPTQVKTNLNLKELFQISSAPYKILLKNKFVCFSPEIFIQVNEGIISSNPMKGTIDGSVDNARVVLKNDRKELAEHNTIVDLIRNDLSIIADNIEVEKFRYIDRIKTNNRELLQMSSKITGKLTKGYESEIGTLFFKMLPAGSISGAPKPKTVEIIKNVENYERGYYTGIFGIFDGKNLDSCVLIRYIEQQTNGELIYKSGGGITFQSKPRDEYDELLNKVYVPIA